MSMVSGLRRLWHGITRSFAAFLNHPRTDAWACLMVPVAFGLVSVSLGMDANVDLFSYHLYNPFALLNGKLDIDLAPAGMQGYFNPVLDVPYYWAAQHWPPRLVGFVWGLAHGMNFVLLLGIARKALPGLPAESRYRVPLLLAAAGSLTPNFLCELGNVMGDNATALFELGGLLVLLAGWDSLQTWTRRSVVIVLAGGLLAGLGVGLKLTNAVYALALCLGFLVVPFSWSARLRLAFLFGVGALLGFAVTGGYWIAEMWHLYGNPLYPQFSAVFPSPLTASIDITDTKWLPKGILETLFWPFVFSLNPYRVTQLGVAQIIWPTLYLLFAAWGIRNLSLRMRRQSSPALNPRQHYLLAFVGIGFVLWMEVFSIFRYIVPIELVAPLAAFVLFSHLAGRTWGPRLAAWALSLGAAAVLLSAGSWGHRPWADTMYKAEVPPLETPATTTVIFTGGKHKLPNGWLATFFPPEVAFVGLHNTFPASSAFEKRARDLISQRGGPVYVILPTEPDPEQNPDTPRENAALEFRARQILSHFGYVLDVPSCTEYHAYAGQWSYIYRFCHAERRQQRGQTDDTPRAGTPDGDD